MRILVVAPGDEEIGGVPSVIGNLTRYLHNQGHEIIFLYSGKRTFAKIKTTKVGLTAFELNLQAPVGERHRLISLILFFIRFPIGMYELVRIIRQKKIQIVNIHYPLDNACYFALCRRIFSLAVVTSVHGADLFPNGKRREKYSRAIRLLLHASDRIVAPSRGFQQDVARLFPALQDKLVCIHNGVNLAELQRSWQDTTTERAQPYLLCIAMHNEKKGLDVLLRAFALMQGVPLPYKLVLVGDGPLRGDLESLALSLGIQHKVAFLGRQGRTQVAKLIQGCEVFVLPSRSEPFGIVLTEAMACQKPVVATTVGGIPEIIQDGTDGILVEPDNPDALAEALLNVLQNQALRLSIAHSGYMTVVKKFSSEKTGASYEALFTDLIDSLKIDGSISLQRQ
jgi:glycosyltransferase involved in cell wall biosynthesis